MYHYLFTNDLRISNLQTVLMRAGQCFSTDTVPSAAENKNENNNMKTLGFYFNLTKSSNCALECANGNVRRVVLNFIKKFQFPNPRTPESLKDAYDDGITVAPMRLVLQVLYNMNLLYPGASYITREEILDFIFYNSAVAKSRTPDIITLIQQIVDYRKNGNYPESVELNAEKRCWKHADRQIREMVKILLYSGCVSENEEQKLFIQHDHLTIDNKAALFDILTYTKFWIPNPTATYAESRTSYEQYMDVEDVESGKEEDSREVEDLMKLENQEFIIRCLDIMKERRLFNEYSMGVLCDKEQCSALFKHNSLHGILLAADRDDVSWKDESGVARYYSDTYNINGRDYYVSSQWRPTRDEARKPIIDWILSMMVEVNFSTGYVSEYARNRIIFGAPGTGKSYTLNKEKSLLLGNGGHSERVTFHPDYSYANFVGTYKPVPSIDSDGKDAITYSYVPGPFMRIYVKALKNSRELNPLPHLLIIEEINRANVAAVFGDVFQLLDRGDDEVSEYPIQASEDIKKYLASELGGDPEDYAEIRLPDNMFIWATMNSADQGVFPMDTAFKRRWDFTYLGIDDSEAGIVGKTVILGKGEYRRVVEWNALRKAINEELLTYKVNEDKLMGPYFISKKNLPEGNVIDPVEFTRIFKNKVIMYLFDDAAKQKRVSLFGGCDEKAKNQYSKICAEFDTKGVFIFCEDIRKKFIEIPEGTEE